MVRKFSLHTCRTTCCATNRGPFIFSAAVSAPIVGTTSLDKLEEIISKIHRFLPVGRLIKASIGAIDIKLSEEEVKYLEEPYKPIAIIGHS